MTHGLRILINLNTDRVCCSLASGALAAIFSSLTVEANTTLYTAASGHKYRGYDINRQPACAQSVCLSAGGHLAVLNDYNEWYDVN